ncbi:hypothetical protein [Streptomyces sp. NPDC006267]|uniref:hypothetical protein n=1 Tax=Streptomyces sp. NPDC006267 TaxID=3157173 RepID=UPI0033BC01E7
MTQPASSPFVPKGEPRPLSGQTCGYKPRTDPADCGAPGTWHVMWDRSSCANSVTCGEHMSLIQRRWVYDDRHPISPDCTMPGALWQHDDQRCAVPGEDDHHHAVALVEPIPAAPTG